MSRGRSQQAERAGVSDALDRELRKMSGQSVLFSQAIAERVGMHSTDLESLDLLQDEGPMTAGRLAELTGLTTGAVTRMIDRLERAGYVRRESDPQDRRRVIIRLSSERASELAPHFESMQRAMNELYDRYSDQELATILDFATRASAASQAEIARLRAAAAGEPSGGQGFSAPLGPATGGQLVFASGVAQATIHADPALRDLYRARFEGQAPRVRVRGGTVTIQYGSFSFLDWRKRAGQVTLNASIPWDIELRGGASKVTADLRALELQSLAVSGGASEVTATLPRPAGTVPVRIEGGGSDVTIRRPAGVAARVRVSGGAAGVTFDNRRVGSAGRDLHWESPDYPNAADRYDIDIVGAASKLLIDTH
ncbi:MAG: MarR family transcriptional regulator [Chloroflexota bacterium]